MSASTLALPGFLVLSLHGEEGRTERVEAWRGAVAASGGQIVAVGYAEHNGYLEIGTPAKSVLIASWNSEAAVGTAWTGIAAAMAVSEGQPGIVALTGACLAQAGLPDFPTRENAAPAEVTGPAAYMLIEGTVTAPEPMGRYRDIIFPMISARGGYYMIYAARGAVTVRHGDWVHQAIIVSRWPDAALAGDFWYCDRYQNLAIPTRTGAGNFSVVLLRSEA